MTPTPDALVEALARLGIGTAALDMLAERRRQIEAEGWTPEHDDGHDAGEMAAAAGCYALAAVFDADATREKIFRSYWLWGRPDWKPKDPRRDLVRAGALILAEIERLDRAAAAGRAR